MEKCLSMYKRYEELKKLEEKKKKNSSSSSSNVTTDDHEMKTQIEFEARLGYWDDKNEIFNSGVDKNFILRALSLVDLYKGWSSVVDWHEIHDFFYKEKSSGDNLRTSVKFDLENKKIITKHIKKNTYDRLNLKFLEECEVKQQSFTSNPSIRLSLATEIPISASVVGEIVDPFFVRIKKRKSYFYTPAGFSEPVWVFDFTLSWDGVTKSEAEQKQKKKNPKYEMEVEFLSPLTYQLFKNESSEYVIQSFLMKIVDFFKTDFSNNHLMLSNLRNI